MSEPEPAAAPSSPAPSPKPDDFRFWLSALASAIVPGALFGTHLGGLIFFLNPNLPFRPVPILRGIGLYAGMLGALTLLAQVPLLWLNPRRVIRLLPWTITLALAAAAALDGFHASYYAYYLPPGINERLLKASIWLAAAALIAFYTALLHTLDRRRYGPRSRWGFAAVAVLSIYAAIERREAFHPRIEPAPRPVGAEQAQLPQLWVVGLDTATLDAILPLAGEGRLPFFAKILSGGAHGRLESFSPNHRDALWMTLGTGKYPWRHGVRGGQVWSAEWIAPDAELRLLPVGFGFWRWGIPGLDERRVRRYHREALALWEVLPRLGHAAAMVGWPASSPASHDATFALADRFFAPSAEPDSAWPPELALGARRYAPDAAAVRASLADRLTPAPPGAMVDALAGDRWRESLTTALLDRQAAVGSLFLVLPGLRHVSRRYFGGYSAVQFDGARAHEVRDAAAWVATYYVELDRYLAQLWDGAQGARLLAVVSASGVEGAAGWRRLLGLVSRPAALQGRFADSPDGILLFYGQGIEPGALFTGAQLVDFAPTLMYALGLPVARDLDGAVLTSAFDKRFLAQHPLTFLPTYEGLAPRPVPPGIGTEPTAPGR